MLPNSPASHLSLIPSRHSSLKQLGEVRCAKTRNRVPSRSSVPASIRDNRATVGLAVEAGMAIASSAATENNVVKRIGIGVQQGVQETKSGLLGAKAGVVEKSDDTAECGGRAGGSLVALERTLVVDAVTWACVLVIFLHIVRKGVLLTETLGRNVRESTSVTVEVGLVLLAELVEVCLYSIVLVRGTLPVVGETTGGEESSSLVEVASRTNRGDKRAGSGILVRN